MENQQNQPEAWPNGRGRLLKSLRAHGNMRRAAREAGVERTTPYQWIDKDPAFAAAVDAARLAGMRGMRDCAIDHIYRAIEEDCEPTRGSLATAVRVLAQTDPARWAERHKHEHSGPAGGAIQVQIEMSVADAKRIVEAINE